MATTPVAVRASEAAGRFLERGRGEWLARYAYQLAARIDLAMPFLGLVGAHPFNGQINRLEMFHSIVEVCNVSAVVETGTCRGATTEYIGRNFSGDVYSCEVDRRYFEYAQRRLAQLTNVQVRLMESRRLLKELIAHRLLVNKSVFFYLDAHWDRDLPLLGELSVILESDLRAIVMIDDFEVPFDEGYGYDTYGRGKKLCLQFLNGFRDRLSYAYFPAHPAVKDSGPRRGCLVFTTAAELDERLHTLSCLRRVTEDDWEWHRHC